MFLCLTGLGKTSANPCTRKMEIRRASEGVLVQINLLPFMRYCYFCPIYRLWKNFPALEGLFFPAKHNFYVWTEEETILLETPSRSAAFLQACQLSLREVRIKEVNSMFRALHSCLRYTHTLHFNCEALKAPSFDPSGLSLSTPISIT